MMGRKTMRNSLRLVPGRSSRYLLIPSRECGFRMLERVGLTIVIES